MRTKEEIEERLSWFRKSLLEAQEDEDTEEVLRLESIIIELEW